MSWTCIRNCIEYCKKSFCYTLHSISMKRLMVFVREWGAYYCWYFPFRAIETSRLIRCETKAFYAQKQQQTVERERERAYSWWNVDEDNFHLPQWWHSKCQELIFFHAGSKCIFLMMFKERNEVKIGNNYDLFKGSNP